MKKIEEKAKAMFSSSVRNIHSESHASVNDERICATGHEGVGNYVQFLPNGKKLREEHDRDAINAQFDLNGYFTESVHEKKGGFCHEFDQSEGLFENYKDEIGSDCLNVECEELMRQAMKSITIAYKRMRDAMEERGTIENKKECVPVFELLKDETNQITFFKFMEGIVKRHHLLGKFRTSETHKSTLESFKRFRKHIDLLPSEIDHELIEDYNVYLENNGVCLNTVSFYNRVLRACYNRAVEKGLTTQQHPFRNVYTGMEKTRKRAISIAEIKRIKSLELSSEPTLGFVRDMFLFSFYTRGMSFIDMAYLKKTDIRDGMLSYRRRKTGQQLFIRWEQCMQGIVDTYLGGCSNYLLPVIISRQKSERLQIANVQRLINKRLKEIGGMAGVKIPLTMYVSRHSWASIAKSKRIPLSIISEGMGHDSETTTRIYLSNLDASVIDEANGIILKDLLRT